MKTLSQTIIGLVAITWLGTGMAVPITANSNASFYHDMVIATGGQLPVGLESLDNPPISTFTTNSDLFAPDAADFDATKVVIAELDTNDLLDNTQNNK